MDSRLTGRLTETSRESGIESDSLSSSRCALLAAVADTGVAAPLPGGV